MTKKRALMMIMVLALIALAFFVPQVRIALGLLLAAAYNLFALLIIGSFAALLGWYLFGILLPGLLRYRRLKQIRYYREVNRRRRWDYEDD